MKIYKIVSPKESPLMKILEEHGEPVDPKDSVHHKWWEDNITEEIDGRTHIILSRYVPMVGGSE